MTTKIRKDNGHVEIRDDKGYIICGIYDNGATYVIAPNLTRKEKQYINNYKKEH